MTEFPDCKIIPQVVKGTITFEYTIASLEEYELIKGDFEEAIERLRCEGSAKVVISPE